MLSLIRELRSGEHAGNEHVQRSIDLVRNTVLKRDHLCEQCLSPYAAGDRFCCSCGAKVEPYGICHECGTVAKGKFCQQCGKAVQP